MGFDEEVEATWVLEENGASAEDYGGSADEGGIVVLQDVKWVDEIVDVECDERRGKWRRRGKNDNYRV